MKSFMLNIQYTIMVRVSYSYPKFLLAWMMTGISQNFEKFPFLKFSMFFFTLRFTNRIEMNISCTEMQTVMRLRLVYYRKGEVFTTRIPLSIDCEFSCHFK